MTGGVGESGLRDWSRDGDDEVLHDGFQRVLRRPLRLPDGRRAVWELMDNPPTVSVLALTDDDHVVMVRQFRPGPDRAVLSLPGGLVDDGEDAVAAGVRELREETGYAAGDARLVATVSPPAHTRPRHTVLATGCRPVGDQSLDELEDIEVVLLPVAELRRLLPTGTLGTTEQSYLALDAAGLL
ncbi:hypothetical protein GCM10023340_23700 [Nocardioides marinquilinus]|uniref:Nudix hydrolase domain-containing protein n=1 Tax=Nocardioides marinquilinus TaxID=1210400 RepID=A0ABP9PMK8_9ACTN